jgi:hypothetical protein
MYADRNTSSTSLYLVSKTLQSAASRSTLSLTVSARLTWRRSSASSFLHRHRHICYSNQYASEHIWTIWKVIHLFEIAVGLSLQSSLNHCTRLAQSLLSFMYESRCPLCLSTANDWLCCGEQNAEHSDIVARKDMRWRISSLLDRCSGLGFLFGRERGQVEAKHKIHSGSSYISKLVSTQPVACHHHRSLTTTQHHRQYTLSSG